MSKQGSRVKPQPPQHRDDQNKTRIYADVLKRILKGELQSGERLVETQLARHYAVSRTLIREVLFTLLRDNLVERHHNRGTQVVSFTPDDVEDLYEIRRNLEILALRTAIQTMPLEPLFDFERRLRQLTGKPSSQTARLHAELDVALHGYMFAHCRNRRLVAYLENVSQLIHSLRLLGYEREDVVRETGEQHLALVRAFVRRDLPEAERLLGEHIETSKRNALLMLVVQREARSGRGLAIVKDGTSG
jgi:DNA-binding GntR family transcriptional regulator